MKKMMSFKKYYTMIFYGILGIGIVLLLKQKNWSERKQMLANANNLVQYMPIDKTAMSLLNPLFDFTNTTKEFHDDNDNPLPFNAKNSFQGSGFPATKRNVSETKKKFVASSQDWKCGDCQQQLDHTYEIDHRLRLQYGGSNDINNLVALCPHCHRKKTATEIM
jgi:hypothetical protein